MVYSRVDRHAHTPTRMNEFRIYIGEGGILLLLFALCRGECSADNP